MAKQWVQLVKDSFLHPRKTARWIMGQTIQPGELLLVALVVTCVGVILAYLALQLSGDAVDDVTRQMLGMPILSAIVEFVAMAVIALLTFRIGLLFGGKGGFLDAAKLVVWLNIMLLMLQLFQMLLLVVVPPLAGLAAIFSIIWAFWAFANFVTELHGFENPWMVLGAVVLTTIVLFISLAMLIAILGMTPRGV